MDSLLAKGDLAGSRRLPTREQAIASATAVLSRALAEMAALAAEIGRAA